MKKKKKKDLDLKLLLCVHYGGFESKAQPKFHLFGNSTGFSSELVGSVKVRPEAVRSFNGWVSTTLYSNTLLLLSSLAGFALPPV